MDMNEASSLAASTTRDSGNSPAASDVCHTTALYDNNDHQPIRVVRALVDLLKNSAGHNFDNQTDVINVMFNILRSSSDPNEQADVYYALHQLLNNNEAGLRMLFHKLQLHKLAGKHMAKHQSVVPLLTQASALLSCLSFLPEARAAMILAQSHVMMLRVALRFTPDTASQLPNELAENVCVFFSNLAMEESCQSFLLDCAAYNDILEIMKLLPNNTIVQTCGCDMIGKLATADSQNLLQEANDYVVSALRIHSKNPSVQQAGWKAIQAVSAVVDTVTTTDTNPSVQEQQQVANEECPVDAEIIQNEQDSVFQQIQPQIVTFQASQLPTYVPIQPAKPSGASANSSVYTSMFSNCTDYPRSVQPANAPDYCKLDMSNSSPLCPAFVSAALLPLLEKPEPAQSAASDESSTDPATTLPTEPALQPTVPTVQSEEHVSMPPSDVTTDVSPTVVTYVPLIEENKVMSERDVHTEQPDNNPLPQQTVSGLSEPSTHVPSCESTRPNLVIISESVDMSDEADSVLKIKLLEIATLAATFASLSGQESVSLSMPSSPRASRSKRRPLPHSVHQKSFPDYIRELKATTNEARVALVIGNDQSLENAVSDAACVRKQLQRLGYVTFRDYNSSEYLVMKTIKKFIEFIEGVAKQGIGRIIATVYTSAHGFRVQGLDILAISNINHRKEKYVILKNDVVLPLNKVQEDYPETEIKTNLLVDICRINRDKKQHFEEDLTKSLSMSLNGIFSCAPGEIAIDGHTDQNHSPFAQGVLQLLHGEWESLENFYSTLAWYVNFLSGNKQHPTIIGAVK